MIRPLILLLVPSILLSGGFALEGVGPRALNLGGAYRTLCDDWSALYWNPAGLAFAENPSLSLSTALVSPLSSTVLKTGLIGYDGGYPLKFKISAKSEIFYIPSLGGIIPLDLGIPVGFGASVFSPFGLGSKWNLYDPPIGFYEEGFTPDPPFPEHDWQSRIFGISTFLGFGLRKGILSLGFSGGPTFIHSELQKVNLLDIATFSEEAQFAPIQFRYFPLVARLEGNGTALSFATGFILSLLGDRVRVGASVFKNFEVELRGNYHLTLYTPKNDAIMEEIEDPLLEAFFRGDVFQSEGKVNFTLPLPSIYGLSLSFRPSKKWLFAIGLEKTTWSLLKRVPLSFDGVDPLGNTMEPDTLTFNWKDTWRFGGGFEYTPTQIVALRVGLFIDGTPIPDETFTPLIPDVGQKVGFDVGVRYRIRDRFIFEGRYEFLRGNTKDFEELKDVDGDGEPDNLPGKYTLSVDTFEFAITVEF
jgi:long-chain fatty acid transport protein